MTALREIPLTLLDGTGTTFGDIAGDGPVLVVNVASRCGLTPQYAALEELARTYGDRGLTVLGAPCNQFLGQEPGTNEEIAEFCSTTYGVTFPLTDKLEVNGEGRHPLFDVLTAAPDAEGHTGDVRWNFEKWLVGADGEVVARFAPAVVPDDAAVVSAIEAALA
jgi:glutathione peroxidase